MIESKLYNKRIEAGISLSELAKSVGIDVMFIHKYEQGGPKPSLPVLRRIAAVLEVPLSDFLGEEVAPDVVTSDMRTIIEIQETGVRHELLVNKVYRGTDVFISHLPPDASDPKDPQNYPGEKSILVLRGNVCLKLGPEHYHLNEDDSAYFDCTIPHQIVAGDEGAEIITAITPPIF